MRLVQYLNEAIKIEHMTPEEQALTILKNCKKYVMLTKKTGPFMRSVDIPHTPIDQIITKDVRTDRNPLGMNKVDFDNLNNWLEKNGHNRRDQSVCACSNSSILFGEQFYFFPIGNFSYTWIKAHDINRNDDKTGWSLNDPRLFFGRETGDYLRKMFDKKSEKEFKSYFTTDKGIEIAYKNKYEIWFNCKKYYLVNKNNYDMFEKLKKSKGLKK